MLIEMCRPHHDHRKTLLPPCLYLNTICRLLCHLGHRNNSPWDHLVLILISMLQLVVLLVQVMLLRPRAVHSSEDSFRKTRIKIKRDPLMPQAAKLNHPHPLPLPLAPVQPPRRRIALVSHPSLSGSHTSYTIHNTILFYPDNYLKSI